MASCSPSPSLSLVAIATSSEETLLLTQTGEVLVCHHGHDDPNEIETTEEDDGLLEFDDSLEFLDDCSLNANSFEASITGRNKLHRPQQRHSLQKAWTECCEPERLCDLAYHQNISASQHSDRDRRGGLFGGSEDHLVADESSYNELVNGMSSKLNIDQESHERDSDWNTVSPRRKNKSQRKQKQQQLIQQHQSSKQKNIQQPVLRTPPRKIGNQRRRRNDDNTSSPTTNKSARNNVSDDDDHDERPDRINMNDVQLQDHNNFTFIGGNAASPTPMLSFDYSGYEPPTPERLHSKIVGDEDDNSCTSTEVTFSMNDSPYPQLSRTLTSTKVGKDSNRTRTNSSHAQQEHYLNDKQKQHQHQRRRRSRMGNMSTVLPGVPTFLHHLSQIRITHLSAHPRGRHVLLISEEGLLFSYGSNKCGQLGLGLFHKKGRGGGRGIATNTEIDSTQFTVTTPSIVTPLLENGGKTVNCAAGIDYSLVVVRTEGERLARRRHNKGPPSPSSGNRNPEDCMWHHQMYGFGNNKDMKLGLLDPDRNNRRRNNNANAKVATPKRSHGDENADIESPGSTLSLCFSTAHSLASVESRIVENGNNEDNYVFLPRRVALHCRVFSKKGITPTMNHTQTDQSQPLEYGIFKVAASSEHSAALVRRPSGMVELYTWGKGEALGQPSSHVTLEEDFPSPRRWECVPSFNSEINETQSLPIATPTLVSALSSLHESHSGMKNGAPPRTPSPRKESSRRNPRKAQNLENSGAPKSLLNPSEYLVNVALGPSCTHTVTSSGRWFSVGSSEDGLLGLGADTKIAPVPTEVKLSGSETIQSVSIGEKHAVAVSNQGQAYTWGRLHHGISRSASCDKPVSSPQLISFEAKQLDRRMTLENALLRHVGFEASKTTSYENQNQSKDTDGVLCAHAGRDLSIFVHESGSVLSCGRKSGRLGQGDVTKDVNTPSKMFGGLQLWRNE